MAYTSQTSGIIDHAFLKNLYNGAQGYGIVAGMAPSVTGSSMVVSVASGSVKTASGPVAYAGGSVTLSDGHATLPRTDLVIWDDSADTIAKLEGTPTAESATQSRPPAADLADPNDIVICAVYVAATATTIPSGNVFDRRITVPGSRGLKLKSGDQSVSSSTTLVDCNDLVVPVAANTVYAIDAAIFFTAGTTGDIKHAFTCPTGATLRWGLIHQKQADGSTTISALEVASGNPEASSGSGASETWARISGRLSVGATAGNLQYQFAQDTSNATNTTIHEGSWLRVDTQV